MAIKSRNPKIEFDLLQMYFREPYTIDLEDAEGKITMYQPSLGDLVEFGESRFYTNLSIFVSNTTTYRLLLWEAGIDWNELSDFSMFIMNYKQIEPDFIKLIFHDLDFSKFELYKRQISDDEAFFVLYNEEDGIEINENVYFHISQYLRTLMQTFPKEQITPDPFLKDWYIKKDEADLRNAKYQKEHGESEESSSLQSLVSACVNHPGFKYKTSELKQIGLYEFMDSVNRLQIYENTTALLKGMYSGMIDTKNISDDQFNFMRQLKR